jgi:hypothetical protein
MVASQLWQVVENVREAFAGPIDRLLRRNMTAIATVDHLAEFVSTRSAFIAQKTLYGYLQTRMGLEYPKVFQDPAFVKSLNIAKMNVFAACLSDLTIHGAAQATQAMAIDDAARRSLAHILFDKAMNDNAEHTLSRDWVQIQKADFEKRLQETDWSRGALRPENFNRSPRALIKWAPIAPDLKKYDGEIVENSIRFAWVAVRAELANRLDAAVFSKAWED